jgi:hypothetical protein
MKRTSRDNPRTAARRRRLRRRSTGAVLTFAAHTEFDSAVLYTESEGRHDTRAYPDALPLNSGACVLHPL